MCTRCVRYTVHTVKLQRRAGANPLGGARAAAPSDSDVLIERLAHTIIILIILKLCPTAAVAVTVAVLQCLYYKLKLHASSSNGVKM